jgi:hypothetical protein
MHTINNPSVITHELFGKPGALAQLRLETLYNKVYGVIPTKLKCSEPFELTCLTTINENFDTLYSELSAAGGKLLEEGVWVGKSGTIYENIFLSVSHGGSDGIYNYSGGTLFDEMTEIAVEKKAMNSYVSVEAVFSERSQAQLVLDLLAPYKSEKKGKIYMLASNYGELNFSALPLPASSVSLELNYGKAFPKFHETLVESINEKTSGLYLFYGPPGTGKSSYIKHLLTGEIKRKIAYIPVSMINQLVSPEMLPLLTDNKNIVLVLEDAEKALISRDLAENAAIVSTILNLTDGFIGQALNITVIATFNTAKEKIDEALLRKGRLRMSYEFNKLSVSDSKRLAKELNIKAEINQEMTLADIYNYSDDTGYEEPEKRRVGFNQ